MTKDHLTSAEAAELLGVSPTSIKRWADTGVLECLKTAGKHRRFARPVLEDVDGPDPQDVGAAPAPDLDQPGNHRAELHRRWARLIRLVYEIDPVWRTR